MTEKKEGTKPETPMDARIVSKEDLIAALTALAQDHTVIAPVDDRTGAVFAPTQDAAAVRLEYRNTSLSPKAAVFPQIETLLAFQDGVATETLPEPPETVLFGARPCDARALAMLDRVFQRDGIDDPYVAARRDRLTVIALACDEPGPACFCTSVGGAPDDHTGADVLATDLGEALLMRPVTERGEALLAALDGARPAEAGEIEAAQERSAAAAEKIGRVPVPSEPARLLEAFDSEIWAEIAAGCLGCGACTYACPTCHCFDLTDEHKRGTGRRVRSWDTCALPLFTLHASGHNPRPSTDARLRQRVLHKFAYGPETIDEMLCVGCGRCVSVCPSGIDLRRILARLDGCIAGGGPG